MQPARPTSCRRRLGLFCRHDQKYPRFQLAGRSGARSHLVSTTTSSASGGVYWIPKLEELGKADLVLLLLGGILPICKVTMTFPLLPRSGIRSGTSARQIHRRSGVMFTYAARWHAQPRLVQGRQRESLQTRLVAFLAAASRGAAAIMIIYRLHGER
jgi:hypothetical protein